MQTRKVIQPKPIIPTKPLVKKRTAEALNVIHDLFDAPDNATQIVLP